jgi:ankyrin repeat protein
VQLLLRYGADVNSEDKNRESPLQLAASSGRSATVKALLDNGANIDTADCVGWSALHGAVNIGDEATVRVLVENGVMISADEDGWAPLHVAVLRGSESIVKLLLENGADLKAEDSEEKTAQDWAALPDHEIEDLEWQARAKVRNRFTLTGLRIAASEGDDVRVRRLLKNGADINERDDGGWYVFLGELESIRGEFWNTSNSFLLGIGCNKIRGKILTSKSL